jgi:DNA topoisomerase-2
MSTSASASVSASNLAQKYQQKTDKQHVLDNPDTYIGSIENIESDLFVFDNDRIISRNIPYNPALYKLFDEAIVNARDHVIRMIQQQKSATSEASLIRNVTYINVSISDDGTITIENDGNGLDIAKHPETGKWIPHMVFAELRTSTNYDKSEKKIVGGKNGYGVKLIYIWSTFGSIETVDHTRKLKYYQEFRNNLDRINEPVITKVSSSLKPYTRIIFKPDYARLGLPGGLSPEMISLLKRRVYDIAAVSDHSVKKLKITYNTLCVPVKNFQGYVDLYLGSKDECKRVYESVSERWEYAIALSPTHEFVQVSFVNGISTPKGGKHVEYIYSQICRKLAEYIEKKKKVKVNPSTIKEQLMLFLRCDIENPAFDSQTKDYMNTPSAKFGSSCAVTDAFIEKVAKMGVMEMACSLTEAKDARQAKKSDGSKIKVVRGIANFIDANYSGGPQSRDCILILCEGLSAMSGIVSGLSSSDRNTIGIYPLKGKLLNVRGEQVKKIADNKEITDIKKILGLELKKAYQTLDDVHRFLRYGKIMIMTDQDLDGSHIKGLCINLFHSEWASLVQIPGFISFMNTPILRAKKGSHTKLFYNDGEYAAWKEADPHWSSWTIKYFKGLGTSTSAEFKEYFANKKIVDFVYGGPQSDDTIDKVFNKKRPDDRKTWLEQYDKTVFLDTNRPAVKYEEFIDQEMVHFSTYDCARSIPNMVDGLKTSLRKILFSAFKRRLTSEIKVAQFSGYVSEHSAYHHGEASLNGAIVNMAQNFVGSNNINLLEPNGQFGTRLQGGDDSASERYIFTMLNPLTRSIFKEADDRILTYIDDDGMIVEPEYYVPIIPFALVNGISGIGTGFSCSIPAFDPIQIIDVLLGKLQGPSDHSTTVSSVFKPYYEGFKGTVEPFPQTTGGPDAEIPQSITKYLIKGCYEHIGDDKIRITELPVGTWTMPYITFLEGLAEGVTDKAGKKSQPVIKDFVSMSTEVAVDITVTFPKDQLKKMGKDAIEKLLRLSTTVSTTNMHMFDAHCKLRKYADVQEVINEFYMIRLATYGKRKQAQIKDMNALLVRLSNRAKYIQYTLDDKIDLRKKTAQQVTDLLHGFEFDEVEGDYKYLIKMPMDSVTQENVAKIMKEKADTEETLRILQLTTLEQMWSTELEELKEEYLLYRTKREKLQLGDHIQSSTAKASKVPSSKASKAPSSKASKVPSLKTSSSGGGISNQNNFV